MAAVGREEIVGGGKGGSMHIAAFGAEVAASVAERLWDRLEAPVRRLGSPRAPISYAPPLEDRLRVAPAQVAAAVETLVAGGGS